MTSARIRGGLLARNTIWNLLGLGAPLIVAIFAIPLLIDGMGTDRFGMLTLAWMGIGYFSLFDFGLGRALTKLVAEKIGADQHPEIPSLVWTGLLLMAILAVGGTLVAALLSPWLVYKVLEIPGDLQTETLYSFYLLALSLPVVVVTTTGLQGILEAHQRFDLVNAVRIPMGAYTFLAPLFVLPFSQSLLPVVGVLVIGRLVVWLILLALCFRVMPAMRQRISLHRSDIRPLISFGSWMTVSNTISPLMHNMDRFIIGAQMSAAAVAYYATPFEVITKVTLIPRALVGVLFPAFSSSFVNDKNFTVEIFIRSVKYLFLILFPIVLIIVSLAYEGIDAWLGEEFARKSTPVLRWLAVGVFLNSLAQIPFALVQGAGRPDLTAKLHLIELPFYLAIVWFLIGTYGIEGAAIAWTVRVALDTLALFAIAGQLLSERSRILLPTAAIMVGPSAIFAMSTLVIGGILMKGLLITLALMIFTAISWQLILTPDERRQLQGRLGLSSLSSG